MSYKILSAITKRDLERLVNDHINEGWWPLLIDTHWHQSMVQRSPNVISDENLKQAAEELAALRGASVREHRESIENRNHDGFGQ